MWINREVNIPEQLISAQRSGQLVVFAGAGISMGAPSDLPDFSGLASKMASGAFVQGSAEPLDAFVGRLEENVHIQDIARRVLTEPTSLPCALHEAVVSLFGSGANVRIVTTNFDRHLTTVARAAFGQEVDVFYAPALPLGGEFSGLVYLHGSVDRRERLVMADSDFGRAYLTSAWASRFLNEMFGTFVVLFVGYSHQDPVMRYMARAYGKQSGRFAFTLPGADDDWRYLGIQPVHFPVRPVPTQYEALTEAIRDWGKQAKMGALDHEERIRKLVGGLPPLEPDSADYLRWAISEGPTRRFFVHHARGVEWLQWVEEQGALKGLFQNETGDDSGANEWARWLADSFLSAHPKEVFTLIARNDLRMGPRLWHTIAFELARQVAVLEATVLSRWVSVLCNALSPTWGTAALGQLLAGAIARGELEPAFVLFRCLVTPRPTVDRIRLMSEAGASAPRLGVEWHLTGDEHELRNAWQKCLVPRLDDLWGQFLPMLSTWFDDVFERERLSGFASDTWDPLSYSRPAIEPHTQNENAGDWAFVLDAARDVIEWLVLNRPSAAKATIQQWSESRAPILRRLAIHALGMMSANSPDAELRRIERTGWLYRFGLKHEMFKWIARAYANASESARLRFLDYSLRARMRMGTTPRRSRRLKGVIAYERYNLAAWLRSVAPESPATVAHFDRLQAAYPDFQPREHPDFEGWSGSFHSQIPRSPLTAAQILAEPREALLRLVQTYSPTERGPNDPSRDGLLIALRAATKDAFEWSMQLAHELVQMGEGQADIWQALVGGWRDATLDSSQWQEILGLLSSQGHLRAGADWVVVDLLESAIENAPAMTDEHLEKAEQILDDVMERAAMALTSYESSRHDWLNRAINDVGGRVMLAWLRALARRRGNADTRWAGLPGPYLERFNKVVTGTSAAHQMARVVIASRIELLVACDEAWTAQVFVPLFDWDRNVRTAEQVWHAFAGWGQWNDWLVAQLIAFLPQVCTRLETELKESSDQVLRRLAAFAVYSTIDPWNDGGWLMHLMRHAGDENRAKWAQYVERDIQRLTAVAQSDLWRRWLRDFVQKRLLGVPSRLEGLEMQAMIAWVLALPTMVEEYIEMLLGGIAPGQVDQLFLHRLQKSGYSKTHPSATMRLLLFVVTPLTTASGECHALSAMVRDALAVGAETSSVLTLAEHMARLGCPTASDIAALARASAG